MTDLIAELRRICGEKHVVTGDTDRSKWDHDVMGNYRGLSRAAVFPASTKEVSQIMQLATRHRVPVVPQGGNTGLAGGAAVGPDADAILLGLARMNRIETIDPQARIATVEAGVILQSLHDAVDDHDLIFPLFFGARGSCMIGGNLSTNAGGSNVVRYGNTRSLTLGIEAVLPCGKILNLLSRLHKDNTGYDLKNLLIGAEGTLGVITRATLKLFPKPAAYATALLTAKSLPAALDLLRKLQDASGNAVEAFEFMPKSHMDGYARLHPDRQLPLPGQDVNILVELGATSAFLSREGEDHRPVVQGLLEAELATALTDGTITNATLANSSRERLAFWHIREAAFEIATAEGPTVDTDIAFPLDKTATFLDHMAAKLPIVSPGAHTHIVAHLGDGNIHYSVLPPDCENGVPPALKTRVTEAIEDEVAALNGSFSAEHGIGLSKRETMARRKDPVALNMMRQIKSALDPHNIMNPGKLLP